MRELHVVALSSDGTRLVLATSPEAKRGGFSVLVDERLQAALRGELTGPGEGSTPSVRLTPREIQTRLRAGASPEDLARESGLPVSRIERFSGPVLSERQRVIDEVRAAVLVRGRRGPSALPLGDAVDEQLPDVSGLKPESESWTAWRADNGTWTVELHYNARSRNKVVRWSWDPSGGEVVALDNTALALGHIEVAPRRRRRPPPPPGVLAAAGPPGRRRTPPPQEEQAEDAEPERTGGAPRSEPAARSTRPARSRSAKASPARRGAAASSPAGRAAADGPGTATRAAPTTKAAAGRKAAPKKPATKRAATKPAKKATAATAAKKAATRKAATERADAEQTAPEKKAQSPAAEPVSAKAPEKASGKSASRAAEAPDQPGTGASPATAPAKSAGGRRAAAGNTPAAGTGTPRPAAPEEVAAPAPEVPARETPAAARSAPQEQPPAEPAAAAEAPPAGPVEQPDRGGSVVPLRPSARRERPESAREQKSATSQEATPQAATPQAAASGRRPGQRGSRASVPSWADVLLSTTSTEGRSGSAGEDEAEEKPPRGR